jgi:hypothetical protein
MTEVIKVTIDSSEPFSGFKLPVAAGQVIEFACDKSQRWKDLIFKSSPEGFFNPLAWIAGLRVRGVKCLALCGCYNDDVNTAFKIGTGCRIEVQQDGYLSFFANDTDGYYYNNYGAVELEIRKA